MLHSRLEDFSGKKTAFLFPFHVFFVFSRAFKISHRICITSERRGGVMVLWTVRCSFHQSVLEYHNEDLA